ncbi:hypothetical protein WJX75_005229 [Coccomyxa subellipsoidea]|uniref:Galactose oxidase n=1 Tax=Coccomyxa subellipsoidea TaxID=248742 RepID=A0ABR2YE80_9CHLO
MRAPSNLWVPKMLAVGGYGGNIPFVLKTSELYSQSNGTWSASGSMNVPRTDFASVLLDNGQVLVAGGAIDNNGGCTNTAEVYDPTSGTWTLTGSMTDLREAFRMVVLLDGSVLVMGGYNNVKGALRSTEIYNITTGLWNATSDYVIATFAYEMVRLPNGLVLAYGSFDSSVYWNLAALYDPSNGVWSPTASLAPERGYFQLKLLQDDTVLACGAGGKIDNFNRNPPLGTKSADVYDVASGTWSATGPMLNTTYGRYNHQMLLLSGL